MSVLPLPVFFPLFFLRSTMLQSGLGWRLSLQARHIQVHQFYFCKHSEGAVFGCQSWPKPSVCHRGCSGLQYFRCHIRLNHGLNRKHTIQICKKKPVCIEAAALWRWTNAPSAHFYMHLLSYLPKRHFWMCFYIILFFPTPLMCLVGFDSFHFYIWLHKWFDWFLGSQSENMPVTENLVHLLLWVKIKPNNSKGEEKTKQKNENKNDNVPVDCMQMWAVVCPH